METLKICICAKSRCGGATDNNVHATTAIEIRCNINSDSCSNFNFSDNTQIIKKRTITALNFWRRRETHETQKVIQRAYFSTGSFSFSVYARGFVPTAAESASNLQESALSVQKRKQPVQKIKKRHSGKEERGALGVLKRRL